MAGVKCTKKNIERLDQVTKEKAAIRHISRHRNPDGTLDVKGNLKIWKDVTSRFTIENEIWGRNRREQLFLAPEKNISADTPPFFIWQTMSDDGRHGMNLAKALQDAWVPYEIHIFQNGEHGLAMADGNNDLNLDIPHIHHWGELCTEWLKEVIWERKIEKGENVCVGQ